MKNRITLIGMLLMVTTFGFSQTKKKESISLSNKTGVVLSQEKKELNTTITIYEEKDFTWDLPQLTEPLGYKSITMSKGSYPIVKNEQYPYGKIILDVVEGKKSDDKAVMSSKSILGSLLFRSGFYSCELRGLNCCKRNETGMNNVKITSVVTNNNLIQIELEFLTEDLTNGEKWNGNLNDSDKMNMVKKAYYQAVMLQLVTDSKLFYKQGQNVNEFASATGVNYNTLTQNGKFLLNDIFKYVSKNVSDKELLQSYDGISVGNLVSNPNDAPKGKKIKEFWKKLKLTLDKVGEIICIWSDEC